MPVLDRITVFLILAFLAESLTEYLFGTWVKIYTKYIAVAVGIALAVNFRTDFFEEFLGLTSSLPYVGCILTGILLGRGSNWLHELWKRFVLGEVVEQRSVEPRRMVK